MNEPLVSIAMPFYNAAPTIGASIRSILLQSHANWELLLLDDGSTDAGREAVRAFDDPRIVLWGDHRRLGAGRSSERMHRACSRRIHRAHGRRRHRLPAPSRKAASLPARASG